jgi:hypothetical protein
VEVTDSVITVLITTVKSFTVQAWDRLILNFFLPSTDRSFKIQHIFSDDVVKAFDQEKMSSITLI